MTAILTSVQVGRIAPLGPDGVPSGFVKHPVSERIQVRAHGLAGDEQADLSVHGGPEKAVYGYARATIRLGEPNIPTMSESSIPAPLGRI